MEKIDTYKMKCPVCGYQYRYVGPPYGWETCPIGKCGRQAKFGEFIVRDKPDAFPLGVGNQ